MAGLLALALPLSALAPQSPAGQPRVTARIRASVPQAQEGATRTEPALADGKGFGGGEATRDPEPTVYDPNDPKGKQQAIHKAESFAEYLAKRKS